MRRIVTKSDLQKATLHKGPGATASSADSTSDNYTDKIVKLLPAEIVAAYIAIASLIDSVNTEQVIDAIHWGAFGVLLVCTPFYIKKITSKPLQARTDQIIICTISFILWAFAFGGPFATFEWYDTSLGDVIKGVLLILWTVVSPLLVKGD